MTNEEEIHAVLSQVLRVKRWDSWAPVDAIYQRLEATGQTFTDSADLLREDSNR